MKGRICWCAHYVFDLSLTSKTHTLFVLESIATKQLRSLQMEAATAPSSPSRRTRPTETKNAVDLVMTKVIF